MPPQGGSQVQRRPGRFLRPCAVSPLCSRRAALTGYGYSRRRSSWPQAATRLVAGSQCRSSAREKWRIWVRWPFLYRNWLVTEFLRRCGGGLAGHPPAVEAWREATTPMGVPSRPRGFIPGLEARSSSLFAPRSKSVSVAPGCTVLTVIANVAGSRCVSPMPPSARVNRSGRTRRRRFGGAGFSRGSRRNPCPGAGSQHRAHDSSRSGGGHVRAHRRHRPA